MLARIRISGSAPLTYESGPDPIPPDPTPDPTPDPPPSSRPAPPVPAHSAIATRSKRQPASHFAPTQEFIQSLVMSEEHEKLRFIRYGTRYLACLVLL
jgi:hypothetical protein